MPCLHSAPRGIIKCKIRKVMQLYRTLIPRPHLECCVHILIAPFSSTAIYRHLDKDDPRCRLET